MDKGRLINMAKNASYLITGGAGFIGSNFVRHLYAIDDKASVRVLDKLTYSGNSAEFKGI